MEDISNFFGVVLVLECMTVKLLVFGENTTNNDNTMPNYIDSNPQYVDWVPSDVDWMPSRDECPTWEDVHEVKCQPILVPKPNFDPSKEVDELNRIIESKNYHELKYILVKTFDERFAMRKAYKDKYNTDLQKLFMQELYGNFRNLAISLMKPMSAFYHDKMFYALNPNTTRLIGYYSIKTNAALEMIGCLSRKGLEALDMSFRPTTTEDGRLCPLIRRSLQHKKYTFDEILCKMLGKSDDANVSDTCIQTDLQDMVNAGKRDSTIQAFNRIISERSNAHVRKLLKLYEEKTGKDFISATDDHYKPQYLGRVPVKYYSLFHYCYIIQNRSLYLATRLYNSLKNLKTRCYSEDHDTIRRILIGRAEIDMGNILAAFINKYNITLADHIQETICETPDKDYRDFLLNIIKNSPSDDNSVQSTSAVGNPI